MTAHVILALGSNMGDRLANLDAARENLAPAVQVVGISPVYETPPWGIVDQPAFLNQVLAADTDLKPLDLLAYLKGLEQKLGRQPNVRYGPRSIDLDILFYDNQIVEAPGLSIPHPRLAERAFVLVPLADLAPDLRHPVNGLAIREMLAAVDQTGIERYERPAVKGLAPGLG